MSKIYNNKIDKLTDWGGDESTLNLPVSGNRIQEFLKDSLDNKIGILHYDTNSNRYLCFADEINRDEYLNDTTKTELLLGTFDAPFNYSAEINLQTPNYNAVFLGATGNYIRFTYDIKNKQGNPTGEDAIITYTIVRNSVRQTFTEIGKSGQVMTFNLDSYLKEGLNSVTINVRGRDSLAATVVNVTYQVVNLVISDELDITKVYDIRTSSKEVEIPFSISGQGVKTTEWYLDGVLLEHDKYVDEVVSLSATNIKYITLSSLSQGVHSIQLRAYTVIDGERFYSDTLYRDVIVTDGSSTDDIIAISGTIPVEHGVFSEGEPFKLYDITQYIPYDLKFATHSPTAKESLTVNISLDDEVVGSVESKGGILNIFSIVSSDYGTRQLKLESDNVEYDITLEISKTLMDIVEINNNLILDFNAVGKSNNSKERNVWKQGEYSAKFNNFNWNNTSGWVNNRLLISDGASLDINYAPLKGDVTSTGKTIEFEFMTSNVTNDDAILCDLRDPNTGAGICVHATKITMKSINGTLILSEFNENELVRISLVINRKSGSTNKQLSFIYTNGIVSRSTNWVVSDNYTSDKMISFKSSNEALIEIKQLRIYESALNNDQILNNYILYRDDVTSMVDVYERNNVYIEGTTKLDPEKMASRVPVMIFTGNIPVLEDTQDKNTLIMVDIEYINMLSPETSFTMKNAALRPQGTSSMAYPKKNFRIYTEKYDTTKVYDYLGEEIENKLYSFKLASGKERQAQPVNCWCLKADYAESSGTHNTGVSRIWNEILFNAQVDPSEIHSISPDIPRIEDPFVFRTEAQKAALKNNYPYDVRTTVDGFPILVFYRLSEGEDLIFIGKYNFNNDKSTESVFGFENVPGFNNSKMQCFEIRNNGHPLALFTNISNFDTEWDTAWESRYPDSKNPSTLPDLKRFSIWMNGINGDHERFKREKWDHFNVYNVAAYYSYLMRFGAVDQTVKNVFLTSEDGEHYYVINYDNDTILGVINTGDLAAPPTVDRTTKDASGNYIYAGHDSVLWNMFEADEEFMKLVPIVDYALTTSGLNYKSVVELFNDKQSDKWVEQVYNQDAQYKYIDLFNQRGENNLFMLQGKRDLHRRWWLAKRFAIYDSIWVSGDYRSKAIVLKCQNDTQPGLQFTVTAGEDLNYGYGINSGLRETGIYLREDESYTFTTTEKISVGDVFKIFGSPQMKVLDLSPMAHRLEQLNVTDIYAEHLGTRLEKLIVGRLDANNQELITISGLPNCKYLKELNVEGLKAMTSLDLRGLSYVETVKAKNSNISAIVFEKGSPIKRLELPDSLTSLVLEQLPYLQIDDLSFGKSVRSVKINNCSELSKSFNFVYKWYNNKLEVDNRSSFVMDSIFWENVDPEEFITFLGLKKNGGELSLKGVIKMKVATPDLIEIIRDLLGKQVFERGGELFISAPDYMYMSAPKEVFEGETAQFDTTLFSDYRGDLIYQIVQGARTGVSINRGTGLISTVENGNPTMDFVIKCTHISTQNVVTSVEKPIRVIKRDYPSASDTNIVGDSNFSKEFNDFEWRSNINVTGNYRSEWTLTGEAVDEGYIELSYTDNEKCTINKIKDSIDTFTAILTLKMFKVANESLVLTLTRDVAIVNESVAISRKTNPELMDIMYNNGMSSNIDYMTKLECSIISEGQIQPGTYYPSSIFSEKSIKSFEEFKYFTNLTTVPKYCFYKCSLLSSIIIPDNITIIDGYAFLYCSKLAAIELSDDITDIERGAFEYCSSLTSIYIPPKVTVLQDSVFANTNLKSIFIPDTVTTASYGSFQNCRSATSLRISKNLKVISNYCFYNCNSLKTINVPEGVEEIGGSSFLACSELEHITFPSTLKTLSLAALGDTVNIKTITCLSKTAPILSGDPLRSSLNEAAKNTAASGENRLYVPVNSTGYDTSFWKTKVCNSNLYNFTKEELYTPEKYISLSITADDVIGYATRTMIHYVLTTEGIDELTGETITYGVKGTTPSFEFSQNLSDTESVEIDVSFTLKGFNATTTITQFPYENPVINVSDDPILIDLMYKDLLCNHIDYMTIEECLKVTNDQIKHVPFQESKIESFDQFRYFTNLSLIPDGMFYKCYDMTSITIPLNIQLLESQCFEYCTNLERIVFTSEKAPEINNIPFGNFDGRVTGWLKRNDGINKLIIPINATGYDEGRWESILLNPDKSGFTTYRMSECTGGSINAENVAAHKTNTNIILNAVVNAQSESTGVIANDIHLYLNNLTSASFPLNKSTENTVLRVAQYTYLGYSFETTITQGVWVDVFYNLILNNSWLRSLNIPNPDVSIYDGVYESFSNYNMHGEIATMYVDILGYTNFKLYVRSYGDSRNDYIIVSNLNNESSKFNTASKLNSGITINDYSLVEFSNIDPEIVNRITIKYRKDDYTHTGDDKGYLLIPKDQ